MLWNYLKLACRNLVKQGFRSVINILGLGLGIAICVIVYMYASMELSFNRFHENGDRIYRLYSEYRRANGDLYRTPFSPYELARGLREELASVEYCCGFRSTDAWIGIGDNLFNERVGFADTSFFNIFTFPIIAGDPVNPLREIQSIVLSRSVADKIFGDSITGYDMIIGETIEFPQPAPNQFVVTAVMEDPPDNNSLRFNVLVPYIHCRYYPQCNDAFGNTSIYLLLKPMSDPYAAEEAAQSLIDEFHGERLSDLVHYGYLMDGEANFKYKLQPFKELYLDSDGMSGCYERSGNARVIRILSSIAMLILLIACFNYVMLNIAASMNRLRELGMLNVAGAHRGQIMRHFITESFLITIFSMVLGVFLAGRFLPLFNRLAQHNLEFTFLSDWKSYLFLVIILTFIVLFTSLYVGFFMLRKNQPLRFLRKELISMKRHGLARFFVTLQYFITITLMICSIVIVKQWRFMLRADVGFEKEDVILLDVDFPYQRVLTLKEKLLEHSRIRSVTMSDRNFVSGSSSTEEKNPEGELINMRFLRIDPDYLETFGIELLEGRNFTPDDPVEENYNVLVNETFVEQFGIESPVGAIFKIESFDTQVNIIGVVRDFHFDSMHDEIQPVMMILFPFNSYWAVFVKIDNTDRISALEQIRKAWMEIVPEFTYDYAYLADKLEEQYDNEDRWSRITMWAALIAIFLSCLGLLGISGLLVARRVKEVGIRKTNGATVLQVIFLLNRDILKWVLLAFILACPAGYFTMRRWLQDFALHTDISWWILIIAGVTAILIAFLTITWQTYRAASRNPVTALRYE